MTTRVHRRLPLVLGITGLVLMLTGCRPYKQDAISLLSDALTSYTWSASDKQHIKKSISRIGDALESENWIDNTHLTSDGGKTVFKTDAKAVIELQKVNAGSLTVINDAIADPALAAQRFVPPFSVGRMTWIKPSFLWMAYRSGWGRKEGQERVLAVRAEPAEAAPGATITLTGAVHVPSASWRTACTPCVESTTSTAPSHALSARDTS